MVHWGPMGNFIGNGCWFLFWLLKRNGRDGCEEKKKVRIEVNIKVGNGGKINMGVIIIGFWHGRVGFSGQPTGPRHTCLSMTIDDYR